MRHRRRVVVSVVVGLLVIAPMALVLRQGTSGSGETTATSAAASGAITAPSPAAASPLESVDWNEVEHPLDCDGFGHVVVDVAYATPGGDEVALVLVRCDGNGSPPSELSVYDARSASDEPHRAATLVDGREDLHASAIVVTDDQLELTVSGYLDPTLPRSSPDVSATLRWGWDGAGYRLHSEVPVHLAACGGRWDEPVMSKAVDCGASPP